METDDDRDINQQEFREILKKHKLSQAQAAQLIAADTLESVSERTVRAWLASKTAKTALPCTKATIKKLKRAISATQKTS